MALTHKQLRYLFATGFLSKSGGGGKGGGKVIYNGKKLGAPKPTKKSATVDDVMSDLNSRFSKVVQRFDQAGIDKAFEIAKVDSVTGLLDKFLPGHESLDMDAIRLRLREEDGDLRVGIILRKGTTYVAEIERRYMEIDGKKVVAHEALMIDPSLQGKGIGRQAFESHEKLAREWGADRIELNANCDVGGYMWARQGFQPKDAQFLPNVTQNLSKEVAQRVPRDNVHPDDIPKYDAILAGTYAGNLQDLAGASIRLKDGTVDKAGAAVLLGTQWHGYKELK